MLNVKKGDIFTFTILPDWAEYESIFFIAKSVTETDANEGEIADLDIDVSVIVEFDNHIVKGDDTGMTLSESDMNIFKPEIVTDTAVLAKLLLVE